MNKCWYLYIYTVCGVCRLSGSCNYEIDRNRNVLTSEACHNYICHLHVGAVCLLIRLTAQFSSLCVILFCAVLQAADRAYMK